MRHLSIYVTEDLKTRMDAIVGMNWSDLVRPLISRAVTHHENLKEPTMDTVIERLRASKEEYVSETEKLAKESGHHWAKTEAEYRDLKRLAAIAGDATFDEFKAAIDPEHELGRGEIAEMFGDDIFEAKYVAAFVKAAVEVFQDVADQL
ncbi:MAG TPA: hypothetical protein VGU24_06690 [Microvirga sp.]|nr:hypothetical protein [Microvirga sp.]